MKTKYIQGMINNLARENYEALYTAWFNIPNFYEGRLFVSNCVAALLYRAKGQQLPIAVRKSSRCIPQAGEFRV